MNIIKEINLLLEDFSFQSRGMKDRKEGQKERDKQLANKILSTSTLKLQNVLNVYNCNTIDELVEKIDILLNQKGLSYKYYRIHSVSYSLCIFFEIPNNLPRPYHYLTLEFDSDGIIDFNYNHNTVIRDRNLNRLLDSIIFLSQKVKFKKSQKTLWVPFLNQLRQITEEFHLSHLE